MKKTKVLLTALCALLLVAASVLGTMAYLTDKDEVKNTFTVGQVKIKLDEAKVNDSGKAIDKNQNEVTDLAEAERVKSNNYHLLPGHTYTKDPTLTVLAGSDESYVRLLVTVTFENKLDVAKVSVNTFKSIFTCLSNDWVQCGGVRNETRYKKNGDEYTVLTYEYRYKTTVSALSVDYKLPALFTGIAVPSTWTNADMANIGGFTIGIVGQAIQADGFTDADAAWAAFPTT